MERTTRQSIVAAAFLWLASSALPVVTYACEDAQAQVVAVVNDDTPAPAPPSRTPRPPHPPRSAAGSSPSTPEAAPAPADAAPSPEVPEPAEAPQAPEAAFEFPAPPATITPRGWFGFAFEGASSARPATPDSAAVWRFYDQPHVSMVEDGSPAARAGLRRGDIIIAMDGTPILTPEAGRRFGSIKPGQVVRWTVLRDGEKRQLVATAGERPGRVMRVQIIDLQRQLRRMSEQTGNEEMRRSLEEFKRQMERLRSYEDMRLQVEPGRPAMQRLRYAGVIGASEVEVRGPEPVIVNSDGDEMVISVGNSVVKIRTGEAARKRTGSAAARKPDSPK